MEFKKDAKGNKYVEVSDGAGKQIRVTYLKSAKSAQISVGDAVIACKAAELPTLMEAMAMAYTESVTNP